MNVAVTGAAGRLGQYAVTELLNAGHEVRGIDRSAPAEYTYPFQAADVRDLAQVYRAIAGCDAILHLAAIPSPIGHPAEEVFAINALGTFNVLEAATLLGIVRVVNISSAAALGVAYATQPVSLHYVPVDEKHPLLPQDAYGLSKLVGEEVCHAFHRRTGSVAVSLRFPAIWDSQAAPSLLADLATDEDRGQHTLWSYIEVRDAARACRLALETPGLSSEVFYVSAPETFMSRPSAALAHQYFPDVSDVRGDEYGHWSFHDCSRAARLLGFTATYLWSP